MNYEVFVSGTLNTGSLAELGAFPRGSPPARVAVTALPCAGNCLCFQFVLFVDWPDIKLLESRLSYTFLCVTSSYLRDYTALQTQFSSLRKKSIVANLDANY